MVTSNDFKTSLWIQDCSRFVSYSSEMVQNFLSSCKLIGDAEKLEESLLPLIKAFSNCGLNSGCSKVTRIRNTFVVRQPLPLLQLLLSSALYSWSTQAKDYKLTDKMQVAWKAFFIKACNIIADKLPPGPSPSPSCAMDSEVSTLRYQLKLYYKSEVKTKEIEKISEAPENWANR